MENVFQLNPIDVEELVRCNNIHVGHKERRVQLRVGEARPNLATRDTDLMQDLSIGGNYRMVGFATQNIDRAACKVIFGRFLGE